MVAHELDAAIRAKRIPAWVWVPWIPFLLTSLSRPDSAAVKPVIMDVATQHPQVGHGRGDCIEGQGLYGGTGIVWRDGDCVEGRGLCGGTGIV